MPTYTGGNLHPPILDSTEIISSRDRSLLRFEYYQSDPTRLPSHTAPFHNLLIPVQDEPLRATCRRSGKVHELMLGSGDIALTPANTEVAWEWRSPVEVILVWIDPKMLHNFVSNELKILVTDSKLQSELVINDPELFRAAKMLKANLERVDLGQSAMFDALCRVFLTTLVQKYRRRDGASETATELKMSTERYRALVDFLDANLRHPITTQDIADVVGMSSASLYRMFRTAFDVTPKNFVKNYRLNKAKTMVLTSTETLSNISFDCGFSDQPHMTRLFKRQFGVTPSAYRKAEKLGVTKTLK